MVALTSLVTAPLHAEAGLTLTNVVRTTLERHPDVRIQRENVASSRGVVVEQGAPFDTIVHASGSTDRTEQAVLRAERLGMERNLTTTTTSLGLSSSTGTRWGTTIAPAVTIERLRAQRDPAVMGLDNATAHSAIVGVQLTQSLLRGAGRTRAAGEETAAKYASEAAEQSARFVGSQRALDAVLAYWRLVGARRQLALFEAAEARAVQLVDDTKVMIAADQRPAADLRQVEGNLADRRRAVTQARAAAFEAQRLLGLAMGIPAEDMDTLTELVHELPKRPEDERVVLEQDDVDIAFAERADLASAEQNVRATQVRKEAARGNRLPALDLTLGAGYVGRTNDSGFVTALWNRVPGVGINAAVSLELPVLNKQREGAYQQRAAEHAIADIARNERRRQIATRVRIAANNLTQAIAAFAIADRASELYVAALEDERAKLQAGIATIIDVVVVQDRLLQVQLDQLAAQLGYAEALADYHFALGDLPETPAEVEHARLSPLLGPSP